MKKKIGTVSIIRTDGIYFLNDGGTFEHGEVKGSFAPTVGGAAMVVYVRANEEGDKHEAYEVRTIDIVKAILKSRRAREKR